jgi:thiamine transport system substrate-binding protein
MMRTRTIALLLAVGMLTSACGGEPSTTDRVTVRLLTHDSFDVSKSVLQEFERQSGIDVEILPAGDAGQLVNRAILSAGNPEGDVLFGIDNNLLATALERDVFVPYSSPGLDRVDDAYELDPEHRVTPIDHGEVCVNDDKGYFEQPGMAPPSSLEDLADPAYRDLLVVENPATSTPGLAFLLATVAHFGDPGWESYWRRLRANDVKVVESWDVAYFGEFSGAGGGEGTRPLVVSYATSPVAEVVFAEQPPAEAPTGVLESSCFRQIEFAGILRGTEHEEQARALIDFLLSRPFQEDIPLRMFVYPVADDAKLPAAFVEHAVIPEAPLELSADEIARGRAAWVERWTDIVLR